MSQNTPHTRWVKTPHTRWIKTPHTRWIKTPHSLRVNGILDIYHKLIAPKGNRHKRKMAVELMIGGRPSAYIILRGSRVGKVKNNVMDAENTWLIREGPDLTRMNISFRPLQCTLDDIGGRRVGAGLDFLQNQRNAHNVVVIEKGQNYDCQEKNVGHLIYGNVLLHQLPVYSLI